MDRRVGGREHPHFPIKQRDASPQCQDLRSEDNHDANLLVVDDAITSGISYVQIFIHACNIGFMIASSN